MEGVEYLTVGEIRVPGVRGGGGVREHCLPRPLACCAPVTLLF